MNWLIKFVLGKVSGPVLIYVLLGLVAANAITGALLKHAWTENARAVLQCENQALRDANARNLAVSTELQRIQSDLAAEKKQRMFAAKQAEKEIAAQLHEKEIEHAEAIANMEIAIDEITDEEFLCASEPVPLPVFNQLHDAATAYNDNRNSASAVLPPD